MAKRSNKCHGPQDEFAREVAKQKQQTLLDMCALCVFMTLAIVLAIVAVVAVFN